MPRLLTPKGLTYMPEGLTYMREHDDAPRQEVDMRADGLLWLINRCVFHPRGYALALDVEKGRWFLLGDGTEPWNFLDGHEAAALTAVNELMPQTCVEKSQ